MRSGPVTAKKFRPLSDATHSQSMAISARIAESLQSKSTLSAAEQQIVARVQHLNNFLTQPFFVAEEFTGLPGEYLTIEETIQGCQEILAGRYDNLPEEAFYFIGTIDQAVAKSKILNK